METKQLKLTFSTSCVPCSIWGLKKDIEFNTPYLFPKSMRTLVERCKSNILNLKTNNLDFSLARLHSPELLGESDVRVACRDISNVYVNPVIFVVIDLTIPNPSDCTLTLRQTIAELDTMYEIYTSANFVDMTPVLNGSLGEPYITLIYDNDAAHTFFQTVELYELSKQSALENKYKLEVMYHFLYESKRQFAEDVERPFSRRFTDE